MIVLQRINIIKGTIIFSPSEIESSFILLVFALSFLCIIATLLFPRKKRYQFFLSLALVMWFVARCWVLIGDTVSYQENISIADGIGLLPKVIEKCLEFFGIFAIVEELIMVLAIYLFFLGVMLGTLSIKKCINKLWLK